MKDFILSREEVARFVRGILVYSNIDFRSIMITKLEKSEDYSVHIVTDTSWVDIEEMLELCSFKEPTSISLGNIQVG